MGPINVCEIIVIVNDCDRMGDVSAGNWNWQVTRVQCGLPTKTYNFAATEFVHRPRMAHCDPTFHSILFIRKLNAKHAEM